MKVGDTAPNFILKDEKGNEFELYKNLDRKILLVFYPKDDTPVCSSQLSEYNHNLDEFSKLGIKVIGINADTIQSHVEFCNKLEIKIPLLADENKNISRQYGALNLFGMNKRVLILIGTNKKVLWIAPTLTIKYIKTSEILRRISALNSKELT